MVREESGIVIVGAGQAGSSVAVKLRAHGYAGPITLVGADTALPYQRPPLSKRYLTGEVPRDRLYLKPDQIYRDQEIDVRLGAEVERIDRDGKAVVLTDGERLPYFKLVLTTGARPRRLPAAVGGDLDNVHTFRTLDDADRLREEFRSGRHLLIVGGGYIGLETAAVGRRFGMNVVLVEQAERILGRVAATPTADHIRALHVANGVTIHEGISLRNLEASGGRAVAAELGDGRRIPVDVVVVGIGVEPEAGLAEACGLEVDDGIVVDACGRTSDADIFAAGDCTRFLFEDTPTRLESVQNAIDQAEHVAEALLGAGKPYVPVPWFWSDQYATKLQIAGLNRGYTQVVVRPSARPGGLSVWYFNDANRLLAVDAIDDARAYMTGKRWIAAGVSPDRTRLADPAAELKSLCD